MTYDPRLDGLRGISILLVLGFHARHTISGGFIGVDVFFVLSGFLITTILMNELDKCGTISFVNFYKRRALRLLPALFILLVFVFSVALIDPNPFGSIYFKEALATLFYATNWVEAFGTELKLLQHAWSLSIEEQFYVLWPVCLLFLAQHLRRSTIGYSLLAGAGGIAIYRAALFFNGAAHERLYYGTDTRADALLIGCAAALIKVHTNLYVRTAALATTLVWALFLSWQSPLYIPAQTLLPLCIGVGLQDLPRLLAARSLVWIGKLSYSLYLWHYPIFFLSNNRAVAIVAAFAAATISYYAVERPFLKLKRRPTCTA